MKQTLAKIFTLIAFAAAPCAARAADLPDGWLTSFPKALDKAKADSKPVLAVFSAAWCGPCQEMIHEVFPKPEVRAELAKWVPVYIDVDLKENKGLTEKYKVEAFPSFVLLSPSGAAEDLQRGARPAGTFVKMLQNHQSYTAKAADIEARLKASDKDAQAWRDKGENELLKDRLEEAMAAYKRVAALDPENKLATADNLAYLEAMPREHADPKTTADKLAAFETKYPDSDVFPRVRMLRIMATINMEDLDGALALANDGVKRFPDSDQIDRMKMLQGKLKEYLDQQAAKGAGGNK